MLLIRVKKTVCHYSRGLILIPQKTSITPFPSSTPKARSQRSYTQFYDSTVNTAVVTETQLAAESTCMPISQDDE